MRFLSSVAQSLGAMLSVRLSIALLRVWLVLARRDVDAARKLMSLAKVAKDRQAAHSALAVMLRTNPADAPFIESLARFFMKGGDPVTALGLYVRHARLVNDPVKPRLYRNAYMEPALVGAQEPYVHVLRDVNMETNDCAIFEGDHVYFLETMGRNLARHPFVRKRVTPDIQSLIFSCPEATRTIQDPVVLLGTDGAINYSHWLTRQVLKLALVERAGIPTSVPLLINENPCAYQRDLLRLVGIADDRLLPVPRGIVVRCLEIIVPVHLRNHPRMHIGIDWLRARLSGLIEPPARARDLLFVSRRDSQSHVILNESEIEKALTRRGFRTVVLSEMSFEAQVRSFSRARLIVAGHGAGLTNLLFAPSGAAVVEITNTYLQSHDDFRFIAGQLGQRHFAIVSDQFAAVQREEYRLYHDYHANADAVLKTVDGILDGGIQTY